MNRCAMGGISPGVLFVALACLAGCQDRSTPAAPTGPAVSSVYLDFKPETAFRGLGFDVKESAGDGHINPTEQYGWRPIQGSLTLPEGTTGCEVVALGIRQALNAAVGRLGCDDPDARRPRAPGSPLCGMIRYKCQGQRGYVHFWLFPDATETHVDYAILLREERSPNIPRH